MVARKKMKEAEDGNDAIASSSRGQMRNHNEIPEGSSLRRQNKRNHNEIPEGSSLRGKARKHNEIPEGSRIRPNAQLSPKLRKQQMKEKLKQLKEARENYMVVRMPRG
mmetsp:Transcript_2967/g.5461  ORF Transcript_2967/g.5461 Transcript_2967/m.5461 type:complete len:108 (+) Transcript_2967:451-774(+)